MCELTENDGLSRASLDSKAPSLTRDLEAIKIRSGSLHTGNGVLASMIYNIETYFQAKETTALHRSVRDCIDYVRPDVDTKSRSDK